jgi:hypothetical protein
MYSTETPNTIGIAEVNCFGIMCAIIFVPHDVAVNIVDNGCSKRLYMLLEGLSM